MTYEKKYYAVNGSNAVAVFDTWYQAKDSERYLKQYRVKKFDTFEDAEEYALEQCWLALPRGLALPEELECNEIIFFKNLLKLLIRPAETERKGSNEFKR